MIHICPGVCATVHTFSYIQRPRDWMCIFGCVMVLTTGLSELHVQLGLQEWIPGKSTNKQIFTYLFSQRSFVCIWRICLFFFFFFLGVWCGVEKSYSCIGLPCSWRWEWSDRLWTWPVLSSFTTLWFCLQGKGWFFLALSGCLPCKTKQTKPKLFDRKFVPGKT